MQSIGVIVLAAGGSTRLGQPKQSLTYNNKTLLQHIVSCVLDLENVIPVVVLGASKEVIEKEISGYNIDIINNEDWQQGMSTSIKAGLAAMLQKHPELEGCIFAVCDQPFITSELFSKMIATFKQSDKGIVAATYKNVAGTPVLFHHKYFAALLQLQNDEGAKRILLQNPNDIALVEFTKGAIDIDTREDYKKLIDAG